MSREHYQFHSDDHKLCGFITWALVSPNTAVQLTRLDHDHWCQAGPAPRLAKVGPTA